MSNALHAVRLVLRVGMLFGLFSLLARLIFGQRIAAVMGLTWKAAVRLVN